VIARPIRTDLEDSEMPDASYLISPSGFEKDEALALTFAEKAAKKRPGKRRVCDGLLF